PETFVLHVLNPFMNVISEVLIIVLLSLAVLIMSPLIAVSLILILIPVSIFTYRTLKNKMMNAQEVSNQKKISNNQFADEMIFGFVDIVLNSKEHLYLNRFHQSQSENIKYQFKYYTYDAVQPRIVEIIAVFSIIVIFSASMVMALSLTQISFFITAFAGSAFRLLPSINRILNSYLRLNSFCGFVYEEIISLKDIVSVESQQKSGATISLNSAIVLENVSFSYPDINKDVLKNINLKIKKSEIVGLIGTSGAGKSTLVKIILGFLKPKTGNVFCDKHPINTENLDAWRKITNYVRQDYYIVHGSIAQNISLELDENLIDQVLLKNCIQKAELLDFVESLPYKEKTLLGEMGNTISGGQKQRIAIARALYSKCEFLVLDEATSALDKETEESILDTIEELNKDGLTVLIIAHKKSTLRICDSIYEMKNGEIALYQHEI
ncbi:MAG: ATP-binding cassette domain-containing protein, partial [Cytophagales bacterium]